MLLALVGITMFSCSGGDDGPVTPPAIDVTKLYGEWKQMPESYGDGRYDDEDYYHSINVNDNLTFSGLWCEGYDKDEDKYEYSRVSGRIEVSDNTIKLYENFYTEDGEFDETEESGPYEVVTLTDDILVLREVYKCNGHVTGYYYMGFYREHAADMLPILGYVSNLSGAEIVIFKSDGTYFTSSLTFSYNSSSHSETNENGKYYEFNQDYLEIVPTNIISNPAKPEDQY